MDKLTQWLAQGNRRIKACITTKGEYQVSLYEYLGKPAHGYAATQRRLLKMRSLLSVAKALGALAAAYALYCAVVALVFAPIALVFSVLL